MTNKAEFEEGKVPTSPSGENDSVENRRRLLKGSLGAAPLVLTLMSRPALGVTCFTPSRSLSRNTSHQDGVIGECIGALSPSQWGSTDFQNTTNSVAFHPLFTQGSTAGTNQFLDSSSNSLSLYAVLQLSDSSATTAKYFIAALLNIRGNFVDVKAMDEDRLKLMWSEFATTGNFVPFAGATAWSAADIVTYFTSNNIVKAP